MAQLSLADFEEDTHKSFGKELFAKQKIKGIRGQAAAGYPDVKPAFRYLKDCLAKGESFDEAGAKTLCLLMSELEDTNIIKRSDIETLKSVQRKAKELLKENDVQQSFELLNKEFISRNISPGGCADLLAVCFLLYFICILGL